MAGREDTEKLLNNMEKRDLVRIVMKLYDTVDAGKVSEIVERVAIGTSDCDDLDMVSERARWVFDIDEDEFYNSVGRTRHGYVDPTDRAWDMMWECLESEFGGDLRNLLALGKRAQATEFLSAIADGLRSAEGSVLTEECVDGAESMADEIMDAVEKGDLENALDRYRL